MANAWRRHLVHSALGYTNTGVLMHKHIFLYLCVCVCVCALVQNKAGCLIRRLRKQIWLNVFIVSWEEGNKDGRCSTVQQGDLLSAENQWRKFSPHTDVAVVHLLHAHWTVAQPQERNWCSHTKRCSNWQKSTNIHNDCKSCLTLLLFGGRGESLLIGLKKQQEAKLAVTPLRRHSKCSYMRP